MGRVYVLSGPSGVGKTTLLQNLFALGSDEGIQLVPRFTDRPQRPGEVDGFENYFVTHRELLQKVSANDFVHIEKWGDYYSAIESRTILDIINSDRDGVVLTSVFGASRLQATYGRLIASIYLWTEGRTSLLNPRALEPGSSEVLELKWRIRKKLVEDGFSEYETASLTENAFLEKRMVDNYLDIASVNGRLRAGEDIKVVANPRDALDDAIAQFRQLRSEQRPFVPPTALPGASGCFVLMPFSPSMKPIYEDHICKVCSDIGITVSRADNIFKPGPVMEALIEQVTSARYVIADLTDNNPNVFYELGICHEMGKKVVLITQNSQVPFNVRHQRHIQYEYTPRGMEALEESLKSALQYLQLE